MNPATFLDRFHKTETEALATPLGQRLAALGFTVQHTGGGCLAWQLALANGDTVWVSTDACDLGTDEKADAQVWGATHNIGNGNEFESSPYPVTIETATQWALDRAKESA